MSVICGNLVVRAPRTGLGPIPKAIVLFIVLLLTCFEGLARLGPSEQLWPQRVWYAHFFANVSSQPGTKRVRWNGLGSSSSSVNRASI